MPYEKKDTDVSEGIGVYIHIPFCAGKCPYCDFYSVLPDARSKVAYQAALLRVMKQYTGMQVDTVYFGGGTPSLMGARWLSETLQEVKHIFAVADKAEITLEVNPGDLRGDFFPQLHQGGFNRVSIGMQSANEAELVTLGRRHTRADTVRTVAAAKQAGYKNISLDLMLALPDMTRESLEKSLQFAIDQDVSHISAYILKIEDGTPFAKVENKLDLPNEDSAADFYFQTVETLGKYGLNQYEISNFAKVGYESKHNLVYWRCREYLGFGPSAHSFYRGKRFYFPRDLRGFMGGECPIEDGSGGEIAEYIMLKLRLVEGLSREELAVRYQDGEAAFELLLEQTKKCPSELIRRGKHLLALTPEGFALSNAVLSVLLKEFL